MQSKLDIENEMLMKVSERYPILYISLYQHDHGIGNDKAPDIHETSSPSLSLKSEKVEIFMLHCNWVNLVWKQIS